MKKLFPVMYDLPERTMSVAGLIYGIIGFYTLPFLALFFSGGFVESADLSWFEFAYHLVNFCVAIWLFKSYLKDSWFNVQCNVKSFCITVAVCAGFMILYTTIMLFITFVFRIEEMLFAASGTLPLVEIELFNLSANLVAVNPIGGLLCTVVLTPVTMSCIYYASGFAQVCSNRPWLAYIVITVGLAGPRALSALTFWSPSQNLILYLVQLPLHWIACYAYQKADTVWAPILTLAVANTVSSLFYLLLTALLS